ncbi:MAG: UDP-N-acetylglucosamine 1-carboxyvinyltransferase [Telmatospirillum sp.]|nr:UDP-N-acetylglucosamine 1-carboxyvinyltransferase [Telmatospirillum sp.]
MTVEGGAPLAGTYRISGAKNAVLPLMVATLLSPRPVTLNNVPASLDVAVLAALLRRLGATLDWREDVSGLSLTVTAAAIHAERIERDLVTRMRASVLLLGALLARSGEADLPLPGGDAIGLRGIDYHVSGLRAMGADITLSHGTVRARAAAGLKGADIRLPGPSVGATENLMLAAVGASGTTTIRNAAQEPEITDLAHCLTAMGATISGIGSDTLVIAGGRSLEGAVHRVMPDRIEFGTLAAAAAITGGELTLLPGVTGLGDATGLLGAADPVFRQAGIDLRPVAGGVVAGRADAGLAGVDIVTQPFPGFPTDLQAPAMALLAIAEGAGSITETIFEHRFRHVDELRKMGANITVRGRTALVRGVPRLAGAHVEGSDVRAAAALLIAGLGAAGTTVLGGLDHLDRGYDRIAEKLSAVGARIRRTEE